MTVRKITIADARSQQTPGQEADVQHGNIIDQRHGGPVTIEYGRYGAYQSIREDIKVDDVMMIFEGQITVTSDAGTDTAGPGEIAYTPKGSSLTITAGGRGGNRLCDLFELATGKGTKKAIATCTCAPKAGSSKAALSFNRTRARDERPLSLKSSFG